MSFVCRYWEIEEENERKKVMGAQSRGHGPGDGKKEE